MGRCTINLRGWVINWRLPDSEPAGHCFHNLVLYCMICFKDTAASDSFYFFLIFFPSVVEWWGYVLFCSLFLSLLSHCTSPTMVCTHVWVTLPLFLLWWPTPSVCSSQALYYWVLVHFFCHQPLRSIVFTVFFLLYESIGSCCPPPFCHHTTLHMCF